MVARRSRLSSSHLSRAASASSSAARRLPRRLGRRRGRGPSGLEKASPSEWAGSVETTSTLRPLSARRRAAAAAHVVFPTPPLPPKNRNLLFVLVADEGGLHARDLQLAGPGRGCCVALPHLADARQQLSLRLAELLFRDLAQLQAHLRGEELLAQHGVVVELGVDGLDQLVQHEAHAADQQAVDEYDQALFPLPRA